MAGFQLREACPVCHSRESTALCDLSWDDPGLSAFIDSFYQGRVPAGALTSGRYRVVTCRHCTFVYQDWILDDEGMLALYRDWVDQARSLQKKQQAKAKLFRQYAGQLQTLSRILDGPPASVRILDFGMGWGYWCRMAQAHGYKVSGFELSPERREHARGMGLEVIDSLDGFDGHFDYIHANQVFEHLPDPADSLQLLRRCLKPGGIIGLRVPDGRGVAQQLRQAGWSPTLDAIHPLEHINCFTRATLLRLAKTAGLRPFDPPLRLNWGSVLGGIRREISDRWFNTHLMLRRDAD